MEQKQKVHEDEAEWQNIAYDCMKQDKRQRNYLEVSNPPAKVHAGGMASLIAQASGVAPLTLDICIKDDNDGRSQRVAVAKFRNEVEANKVALKIRSTTFGKRWLMRLMPDPSDPTPQPGLPAWAQPSRSQDN